MTKSKQSMAALRRLIRQIVREELAQSEEEENAAVPDRPDFREAWERPPDQEQPAPPPPWAVFGSPRPAPEKPAPESPHKHSGPFHPQQELDPPPYIPQR
ncbi:hypothetical protein [Desmospora profundinema]|uniref:Uncharacterized protein n=1 Tax=Desmospora profundinema TaxID=1571184 RepID=A0ABU1IJW4_9BACL|nr:hypothetical protein [Desmospora profundinema]MDR6225056.1 hypothetical protein [Desmospora profundinema]